MIVWGAETAREGGVFWRARAARGAGSTGEGRVFWRAWAVREAVIVWRNETEKARVRRDTSMYGYIIKLCVVILAVSPVYLLIRRPWRHGGRRELALGAFVLFMTGLLVLVLEGKYGNPVQMAQDAARRISTGEGINLVPFRTIGTYCERYIQSLFLVNIVGNIVMFLPWGFGLPLLWKRRRSVGSVVFCSLALPLGIEICQMFIGRSVDIDDLILNFVGGCLGGALYFALRCLPGGREKLDVYGKGNPRHE